MGAKLLALYEPEDLLQDALLVAFESGRARSTAQITRGWLSTLADLQIRTLIAKARPSTQPWCKTALPVALIALDPVAVGEAQTRPGGAELIQDRELAERGLAVLQRLPFEERACFVLHDFAGLGWRAIGAILECSPESVRKIRSRAAASLRDALHRQDGE
jgi:RNA polymerase sigma factor (sigma-70 family)